MQVELPQELESVIQQEFATGQYASRDAVVAHADAIVDRICDGSPDSSRCELVTKIKKSYDRRWGTLDGDLADELLTHIMQALTGIRTEDQISGYNELAEIEGIEKLSPDDDVDCWMHEALFDPVLTRIVREEGE